MITLSHMINRMTVLSMEMHYMATTGRHVTDGNAFKNKWAEFYQLSTWAHKLLHELAPHKQIVSVGTSDYINGVRVSYQRYEII